MHVADLVSDNAVKTCNSAMKKLVGPRHDKTNK